MDHFDPADIDLEFTNSAGNKVTFVKIKDDPTSFKVFIDGEPLDWIKHLESKFA